MSDYMQIAKVQSLAGFLALLLFFSLVHTCMGATDREMVVVFKGGKTEVPFDDQGKAAMRKPGAFRVPAFVGGMLNNKEFFAIFSGAYHSGSSELGLIEAVAKTSYGDYKKWSPAEIVPKDTQKSRTQSIVGDVTALIKGNKIYVLTTSVKVPISLSNMSKNNDWWDPLMVIGTVTKSAGSTSGGMLITWENGKSLKSLLPKKVLDADANHFIGGVGNGVVTKKGTIVLPVQISDKKGEKASSIVYSTDDGATWKIGDTTQVGESDCSVVEWGNDKLLLFARYDEGYIDAYESDDMGATWEESLMFSRVWGNQPNRDGLGSQVSGITAPVDEKDVLLLSYPLNTKDKYKHDTLQLWVSDGQRILCVGTIGEKGKGKFSRNSILAHVGNHLYITHEINPFEPLDDKKVTIGEWDRVIAISPMPHLFENVKNTVRAWRKMDTKLKTKGIPTDGLVGFLGNSKNGNVWTDKYNCVHATVKGGTRVQGGFRFNGATGSGAQWPVASQEQNQLYMFTREKFTIAAAVTIYRESGAEYELLLGASESKDGSSGVFGVGITKDKKWYILDHAGKKTTTKVPMEVEKEYHIALTFAEEEASVYLDGVQIPKGKMEVTIDDSISHFFMGGMGNSSTEKGSLCTVKNVMLFNRALNKKEIPQVSKLNMDEEVEYDNDAAAVLSFVPWMGLVCSIIVLIGF